VGGNQLDLIKLSEQVDPSNRSNVQTRLEEKINADVPQMLDLLPQLTKYIDSEAIEKIQRETDPFLIGYSLGGMYSTDERLQLIQGVLWQERVSGESREDFLDRFPEVVEETGSRLIDQANETEFRAEVRTNVTTFREQLLDKIEDTVANMSRSLTVREGENIRPSISPSQYDIANWVRDQNWDDSNVKYLPELLEYVKPEDRANMELRLRRYRETLSKSAMGQNIDVPTEWVDEVPGTDSEQHEALLQALDNEIKEVVRQYWEDQRINKKNQLMKTGKETLNNLNERQVQILEKEKRDNRADDWTRHDTKQANSLTDRENPLLEVEEGTGGQKRYYLTDFGRVVRMLIGHDLSTAGFPDLSQEVVDGALEEIRIE